MSGPPPNPVENSLEETAAPTERTAWDAAADRCESYRRYLLGKAPTPGETALLARYQQAEQATWDAYKAALRQVPTVAA